MNEPIKSILYADDEPDDLFFMRRTFHLAEIDQPLKTVANGEEAIAYLSGTGIYFDRELYPLPLIMLLDLNMPRLSGFDVLKWIRGTPSVSSLRVVVLTSSNQASDIQRASILGANGYLIKPNNPTHLLDMVMAFKAYWLMNDHLADALKPVHPLHIARSA